MIEKIGPVKNPLTIIAIFAGLAELSGTVVLPLVEKNIQEIFVWFIIAFPIMLVLLFFLTLNFNHKVLYAPSDYRDEENFLRLFEPSTISDKKDKIKEELKSLDIPEKTEEIILNINGDQKEVEETKYKITKGIQSTYFLAEELVLTKLALEFKKPIQRELTLKAKSMRYKFDGIIYDNDLIYGIEVKYVNPEKAVDFQISRTLLRIQEIYNNLDAKAKNKFQLILVIVTPSNKEINEDLKHQIFLRITRMPFRVDLRVYNLEILQEELGIDKT